MLVIMNMIVVLGFSGQHQVPAVAVAVQEPIEVALGP
jgi:hypothetical protein